MVLAKVLVLEMVSEMVPGMVMVFVPVLERVQALWCRR
jgi:hypothetical protein